MDLFNILKEAKSPTEKELLSNKILLEAKKKAERIDVPEADDDYTEGTEDDIDTGEEGTPEEDEDPQEEDETPDYTEGVENNDEEGTEEDNPETEPQTDAPEDGAGNDEVDYTEGADDETEPNDAGEPTGDPEGTPEDGENPEDLGDAGEIDFTAGAEDGDSDGGGDPASGDGNEDAGGDTGDGDDYESDTGETDPEEALAKTKNKLLLDDCIYLYNGIKSSMSKLNEFSDTNILKNKIVTQVKKNFTDLLETLFTFITQSFFANTYVKNLYNYNYFIEAYKINVQLLKKIEVFTANK